MSFGKRTRGSNPAGRTPEGRQTTSVPRADASTGLLVKVAVVTVVLLGLTAASNVYLRHLGRQLDKTFEARMDEGISPKPQLALLKTPLADGWELKSCRLTRPASLADIGPGSSDTVGLGFTTGDDDIKLFADRSTFLQCVAEDATALLCDPAMRTAFLADATALAKEMDFTEKYKVKANLTSANSEFDEVLRKLDAAQPGMISGELEERDARNAESRERLMGALKVLAARGALREEDLGWFARKDFRDAVASVAGNGDACSGHRN